jgi:hypothetical protein
MNPGHRVYIVIAIIIAFAAGWVAGSYWAHRPFSLQINSALDPTATTTKNVIIWETFENTEYHYTVFLPSETSISFLAGTYTFDDLDPRGLYGADIVFRAGEGSFAIKVDVIWEGEEIKAVDEESKRQLAEHRKLIDLDLKSYSESIRNSLEDRKVGGLEEIQFANQTAYKFVLDGSDYLMFNYNDEVDPNISQAYIITENLQGQKIIINYLINDASEKMVQSITFTK